MAKRIPIITMEQLFDFLLFLLANFDEDEDDLPILIIPMIDSSSVVALTDADVDDDEYPE